MSELPCPLKSDTVTPCTVEKDIYNKQYTKINSFNNYQSSQSVITDGQDKTDIKRYTKLLKDNISYSDFRATDKPLIDEFIEILLDTLFTEGKTVRIGKEDKDREFVTGRLLKLKYDNVELVLRQFKSQTSRIKNKRQYITYNALQLDIRARFPLHEPSTARYVGGRRIMDRIKTIYYDFNNSDEYSALGQMPEVLKAEKTVCKFMQQHFINRDYLPVEEMITIATGANEMQGFIYGFRYGVQLMSECFPKGGVAE